MSGWSTWTMKKYSSLNLQGLIDGLNGWLIDLV